jgi:hypothetical protein
VLTADERKGAIVFICYEAKDRHMVWAIKRWRNARPHWTYRHDHFLTLNFDRFITETISEHGRLEKARAKKVGSVFTHARVSGMRSSTYTTG